MKLAVSPQIAFLTHRMKNNISKRYLQKFTLSKQASDVFQHKDQSANGVAF